MALARDVGSALGGFLDEGPQIESRTQAKELQRLQTDLAQRADIRAQVGQELSLQEQGFQQIGVDDAVPTSFTGRGPAALIEVGDERFAQINTPIGIAEARARRSQEGANSQLVGAAIVEFNKQIASGAISSEAANAVAEKFGPAVISEPAFRDGVGQIRGIEARTASATVATTERVTAVESREADARTVRLAGDFEDARVRANKKLEDLTSATNFEEFSLEIELGDRKLTLENQEDEVDEATGRQKLGLVDQLKRGENNPAVREAIINALIKQEVGADFDEMFSASQRQIESRAR